MVTKRFKLIFALVVGLVLVGLLAFQTADIGNAKNEAKSVVGSWKSSISITGGPTFTSGVIFSSDGTAIIMEHNGLVGLGAWEKKSGNQYAFTVWEYFSQNGTDVQAKVSSTITLNDKGNYSGPFAFQLTDLDGNVLASGVGTASGTRNHVEEMPK